MYVSGNMLTNGGDALLLKFDASGNLIWQRAWGGSTDNEAGDAVATGADGSVYLAGTQSNNDGGASLFVVKFDSVGAVLWQKKMEGAFRVPSLLIR